MITPSLFTLKHTFLLLFLSCVSYLWLNVYIKIDLSSITPHVFNEHNTLGSQIYGSKLNKYAIQPQI